MRVHLWSAARDVQRGNIRLTQNVEAGLDRLPCHTLSPIRTRIDMAMAACLIADFADIDLQNLQLSGAKGLTTVLGENLIEVTVQRNVGQDATLFFRLC